MDRREVYRQAAIELRQLHAELGRYDKHKEMANCQGGCPALTLAEALEGFAAEDGGWARCVSADEEEAALAAEEEASRD